MSLQLTGQQELQEEIQVASSKLITALQARQTVWEKIDTDVKKRWLDSGNDPVLTLGYNLFAELKTFFEDIDHV